MAHTVEDYIAALDRPLPTELIRRMVEFRVEENRARREARATGRRRGPPTSTS